MAKAIVVYESKYGNTKRVAEAIAEGMREVPGVEAVLSEVKEVELDKLTEFDAILVGSPNHMGSATKGIRKFIDELGRLSPGVKLAAVFDTYIGRDFEKAVKKMEKQIGEKVPGLKLAAPGLSIKVEGMKGPISEGELPKGKEFGVKMASQLKA
ncbi:MAG TPA: flavodoxin domain-containing protein [Dehalococcoidales bacterium]|nr:flavodoxin domain-containing protein [Dehalococcoidales bacterium]